MGLNAKGATPFKYTVEQCSQLSLACQDSLWCTSQPSDLFVQRVEAILINDWSHYINFVVMSDLDFGRSYGQLELGDFIEEWP
jgi:hypothetical protein